MPAGKRVAEPVLGRAARTTQPGATAPVRDTAAASGRERVEKPAQNFEPDAVPGARVGAAPVRSVVQGLATDLGQVAAGLDTDPASDPDLNPDLDPGSGLVGRVVVPVRGAVVEPVLGVVRDVVGPVGALGEDVVGGLAAVAPVGAAPSWPGLPGLPGLPEFPGPGGVPGVPEAPVVTAPAGSGTVLPAPARAEHPGADPTHHARSADPEAMSSRDAYGAGVIGVHHHGAHHATPAAPAAAHPAGPSAPVRPDDVPSAGSAAGDGGSPRHGDLHAAAFGDRLPVLLLPGATVRGAAPAVCDRQYEIPAFPG
ncbi:hypothetical protein GTW43_12765 [Streptomyces sp. SID5785]|uniref:hypothetical protein n=1 Tax=Streptomyces sp. SID5785 TaxID=2690309 RepID=UPI0013619D07|nr:hypothetical protein [Streptomyces sp. SID5785]MZD05951.1 hypothetical protein [Streptomyces sp. SID5785]